MALVTETNASHCKCPVKSFNIFLVLYLSEECALPTLEATVNCLYKIQCVMNCSGSYSTITRFVGQSGL